MAIMEHAYYASFGYQVTSFFAASRLVLFGTWIFLLSSMNLFMWIFFIGMASLAKWFSLSVLGWELLDVDNSLRFFYCSNLKDCTLRTNQIR